MPRRISYSRGDGKLSHDTRKMMPKNADPERTQNNKNLICMDVQTAYENIFGTAQAEYNAKQKRKDRKIEDYFVQTFGEPPTDEVQREPNAKNPRHSFYEYVVGIGSMEDTAIVDKVLDDGTIIKANPEAAEKAMLCLVEYINGSEDGKIKPFQERNPNFYVFNAQIHMDETTPHLHYDIIPFAEGYQRGMSRQQSISKALEQMGYGTGENAILNFTESERQVFQQICENHGFEVAEPEKGRGQTIETQQYGNIQDAKRAAEKELEQERQEHEENLKQIAVKANEQEVRRILEQEKAAKVQAEREAAESEVENLNAELERKRAAAKNYLDAIEIPPFNPKPYPPKPKLPEKYQTEPVNAYPNYSSKFRNFDRELEKWQKNRDKEQAKIDKDYEKTCAAIDKENENARKE